MAANTENTVLSAYNHSLINVTNKKKAKGLTKIINATER